MIHPEAISTEALLGQLDWIERLARRLVRDESTAADVVQATWIEAVERPPRDRTNLRGWLATVARNAARKVARGEARRRYAETRGARAEAVEGADSAMERALLQRDVVDRVVALAEPYRSVVLLRYFEELSTAEIARRLERPRNTVQTQLARGLAQLREGFDRDFGDRDSWVAALAPLFRGRATAGIVAAHGSWLWILGGLTMLTTAVSLFFLLPTIFDADGVVTDAPASQAAADQGGPQVAARGSTPAARVPVPSADPAIGQGQAAAASKHSISGQLIDIEGRPVAGLTLRWIESGRTSVRAAEEPGEFWIEGDGHGLLISAELQGLFEEHPEMIESFLDGFSDTERLTALLRGTPLPEIEARSAADGSFALEVAELDGSIELQGDGHRVVLVGARDGASGVAEHVLVVAQTVVVRGEVVDEAGLPVEDAYVTSPMVSAEALPALDGLRMLQAFGPDVSTHSGPDGRFELAGLPLVPNMRVAAVKRGYGQADLAIDGDVASFNTLELRTLSERRALAGRVLLPDGSPAAGAFVRRGQDGGRADESGAFRFELSVGNSSIVTARLTGYAPAVLRGEEGWLDEATAREGLELRLGAEPLSLAGRVVDEAGEPVQGARVILVDPTSLDTSRTVEERSVETDGQGQFELSELLEREYRLFAVEPASARYLTTEPIEAGQAGLELTLPTASIRRNVRGVLRSLSGAPVAGATVRVGFHENVERQLGMLLNGPAAKTASDGSFELSALPRTAGVLFVDGARVMGTTFPITELSAEPSLDLRVDLALKYRVLLDPDDGCDGFEFQDATQKALPADLHYTGVLFQEERVSLRPDLGDPVCEVSEAAVALVLFRGDVELKRIFLTHTPGKTQTLRP